MLSCFILFALSNTTAQKLDSLEQLVKQDIPDSIKLPALINLSWEYSREQPGKTLETNELALAIIDRNKPVDSASFVAIMYNQGAAYKNMGEDEKALQSFEHYYNYWKLHNKPIKVGSVLYQYGVVYYNMGDYNKSMERMLEALEIYKKIDHQYSIASTIGVIANLHRKLNQLDKAEEKHKEALAMWVEQGDKIGQANANNNLGNLMAAQGKYDEALQYYNRQIVLDTEANYEPGLCFAYENVGSLYKKMGQFKKAIASYSKAIDYGKGMNDPRRLAVLYMLKGEALTEESRFKEAESFINKGLDLAIEKKLTPQIEAGYKAMSFLYEKKGDASKAIQWYKDYSVLKDSLMNKDIAAKMVELEAKYESAEKENEILSLSADNDLKDTRNFWMSIGLAAVILLGMMILYFLWQRQKANALLKEKNQIISEALEQKNILLKEIHHRVKNNLQVISSLLNLQSSFIEDEQAAEAINEGRNRVHSMALIHQSLYQKDNLIGISVKEYFEKLIHELFHTYRVDQDKIDLQIDVDDLELDVETMIPVGLIINELVTNTLKYAFRGRDSGQLLVSLKEIGSKLVLKVEDDGVGIAQPDVLKSGNTFGYQLIDAFIAKMEGNIDIKSDDGTSVVLTINNYKLAS
ncbi:MAG: tetratricopeptide repeat protein [Bacteroidota bacterium]